MQFPQIQGGDKAQWRDHCPDRFPKTVLCPFGVQAPQDCVHQRSANTPSPPLPGDCNRQYFRLSGRKSGQNKSIRLAEPALRSGHKSEHRILQQQSGEFSIAPRSSKPFHMQSCGHLRILNAHGLDGTAGRANISRSAIIP